MQWNETLQCLLSRINRCLSSLLELLSSAKKKKILNDSPCN
jgi:hypothetical protein